MPRFCTPPTEGRESYGDRVVWLFGQLGWPIMDWQRLVAQVALEVDPETGRLAYREVVVSVPRQNGKSSLLLGVECARCLMWGRPQNVAYTAQTGLDGRMKFLDDQLPVLQGSALWSSVDRVYRAAHNTALTWRNGSRISVLSTGESSGHGKTLDLAVIDEAFADTDNRREQALLPTMATRPDPQIWNVSTAGTPASTYLLRKVEVGRAAAVAGQRSGIAYFEWSVPDDEDIDSPDVWARYMTDAYGKTITEETVRHARQTMTEGDFRRAFCNQWTETDERVIPAEVWKAVCQKGLDTAGSCYAIDARDDRSSACVFKADADGKIVLVAQRDGVDWLSSGEFIDQAQRLPIVVDKFGPAAGQADALERAGFTVIRKDSLEARKSCAAFYDGVADRKLQVRDDDRLDAAVAHAAQRSNAGLWSWHREAPGGELLMGMSLAYAHAAYEVKWEPMVGWA